MIRFRPPRRIVSVTRVTRSLVAAVRVWTSKGGPRSRRGPPPRQPSRSARRRARSHDSHWSPNDGSLQPAWRSGCQGQSVEPGRARVPALFRDHVSPSSSCTAMHSTTRVSGGMPAATPSPPGAHSVSDHRSGSGVVRRAAPVGSDSEREGQRGRRATTVQLRPVRRGQPRALADS
jgi:hypothetical protein